MTNGNGNDPMRDTKYLMERERHRLEGLRSADQEAVQLRHQELRELLDGFPSMYATKAELQSLEGVINRLDKESLNAELYRLNHTALQGLVTKLDQEKLSESVFVTFMENYRIEAERAAEERRAVAAALATSTATRQGGQATWRQISAIVATSVGVLGLVLTFIVLLANNAI